MVNVFVKKCKKKLIFSSFIIILFVSLFFCGYFSESVTKIIVTKAKITSQEYIGTVIQEEVVNKEFDLFYDSVSTDGVIVSSFNVNKANQILSDVMNKLKDISEEFNSDGSFEVMVPVSYLFIPSSYILPNIKLNVETSNLLYYDVKLEADVKEYGINSSLVSLKLVIDISYQVIVPLMFEVVDNSIEVPLALEIINGKVPEVLFSY